MPLVTNATRVLEERIELILTRLYEVSYDTLWGLDPSQNMTTSVADLPLGLEEISAYAIGDAGEKAAIWDGMGDDIPTVEIELGKMPSVEVAMFAIGARWSEIEVAKFQTRENLNSTMPSVDIVARKIAAMGDYFNRREHELMLYGLKNRNVKGIMNQPNMTTTELSFTPYDGTLTANQLLEYLTDLIYYFIEVKRLSSPAQVDLIIPGRLARRLVEFVSLSGQQTSSTVREMLFSVQKGLGINSVTIRNELSGANLTQHILNEAGNAVYPASQDRIIIKSTGFSFERHFYPRTRNPIERWRTHYETFAYSATSGLFVFDDLPGIMYLDYSNATS